MSVAGDRLRTLVSDYYHGLLTFESYREQRSELLDELQIEAPDVRAKEAQPPIARGKTTPKPAAAPAAASSVPPVARPAHTPPQSARQTPNRITAGAAAAAVAIGAMAYVAYRLMQTDGPTPSATGGTDALPSAALSPGATLLEQFMQRSAWHPDAVRNLELTWTSALTDEERQATRASPTFARFADALRSRLRAEEALSDARRSGQLDSLESLVNLARELQMPYADALRLPDRGPATAATSPGGANDVGSTELAPRTAANAESAGGATAPDDARTATPGATPSAPAQSDAPATAPSIPPVVAAAAPPPTAPTTSTPAQSEAPRNDACSAALLNTRRPYCRDALRAGGDAPALVIVSSGRFRMGSDQRGEGPAHEVVIAEPIAMSPYETSFADFNAYCTAAGVRCPDNPWGAADYPVVLVSWNEAVAYTDWLSAQTGRRYRLPTEAEWEYAARAGTQSPYPFGDVVTPVAARSSANGAVDSPLANSDDSVNPNNFRLFHMIGNVREWVADGWQADYEGAPADGTARQGGEASPRVVRGGAYTDGARQLRSAARMSLAPNATDRLTGFRVVRELGE